MQGLAYFLDSCPPSKFVARILIFFSREKAEHILPFFLFEFQTVSCFPLIDDSYFFVSPNHDSFDLFGGNGSGIGKSPVNWGKIPLECTCIPP